jgi:hypothetical protein
MNIMYRCAFTLFAAMVVAAPVAAQNVRNFPVNTLRGLIVFADFPQISLNGRSTQMAPGAQVRDAQNRVMLAGSLTASKWLVHYTLDVGGAQVRDIWVLTPEEAAIKPWPSTLEEAQTWTFDSNAKTWAKP